MRKRGPGWISWVLLVVAVVMIIHPFRGSADTISAGQICDCDQLGCGNEPVTGGRYCYKHTCTEAGCHNERAEGSIYCHNHQPSGEAQPLIKCAQVKYSIQLGIKIDYNDE